MSQLYMDILKAYQDRWMIRMDDEREREREREIKRTP